MSYLRTALLCLLLLIAFNAQAATEEKKPKTIAKFNTKAGNLFGKGDWIGANKYCYKYLKDFEVPKPKDKKKFKTYKSAKGLCGWSDFVLANYTGSMKTFRDLNKLQSEKPRENFDALLGIAWNSIKLNDFKTGKEYANKAIEVGKNEDNWGAYDALAWIAIKEQKYDEALKYIKEEDKATTKAWSVKLKDSAITEGWVNVFQNDWENAVKKFKIGLKRNKECFYCNDGLARFHIAEAAKFAKDKKLKEMKKQYQKALVQAIKGAKLTRHSSGLVSLVDTTLYGIADPKISIKTYKTLAKKWKEDPLYYAKLGYAQIAAQEYSKAEASFKIALEKQPGYYLANSGLSSIKFTKRNIVKEGWELYYKGEYKKAQASCESKIKAAEKEKNPAAQDCIGWNLLAQQKYNEAAGVFKVALKIDPTFYFSSSGLLTAQRYQLVNYNEAWSLINVGSFERAEERLKKAEAKVDADLKFLIDDARAWIKFYEEDYKSAKSAFEKIVSANDKAFGAYKGLAYVALENKDYAGAAEHLTKSLNLNPYQALTNYVTPVNKMQEAGQWEKSKYLLELGQRIYPYSADIQFLLAKAYNGLKDNTTAAQKLVIAAGLAPAYIDPVIDEVGISSKDIKDAYHAIGWGLYYIGKFDEAVKRFNQYFKNGGKFYTGYNGLGMTKLYQKNYIDSEKYFKKALEVRPTAKGYEELEYLDAEAYSGLGWAKYNQEKFKESKDYFMKAVEKWPYYIKATSGLNTLQYRKRDIVKDGWKIYYEAFKEKTTEGAKAKYTEALESCNSKLGEAEGKKNPAAQDCVGWMNLALDKSDDAKKAFEAALKIDKSFWYSSSGLIQAKRSGYTLYNKAFYLANNSLYLEDEAERNEQLNKASELFKKSRNEIEEEDWKWLVDDGEAWVSYYRKDYDQAKKGFETVIKKQEKAYLSFRGLSYVAAAQEKWEDAGKNLYKSLTLAPYQGVGIYTYVTTKLIDNDKFKNAKEILEFGEKVYPYSGDIQFLLAKTYLGIKDTEKATKKAIIAASLAPAYIDPVYDDLGLDKKKSISAYYSMGWGTYFAKNNEQAIKRFDEYFANGGKEANAERGKAFALFRLGKDEEAKVILEKMLKLEDEKKLLPITEVVPIPGTDRRWTVVYDSRSTLGWLHYRNENYDQAAKYFQETINKYPFLIDALTGMGYVKLKQNDKKAAEKFFVEALKLSPYYPDAIQGYNEATGKTEEKAS